MSLFKKYMALFRRGVALTLEYRAQILIWWLTMSMPLVMLAVWLTLAQDGPIGSYNAGDFIAYYLLALYVRQMTAVWVSFELDYAIRHGDLAIKLLYPLNPFHDYVSFNVVDKLMRAVTMTPIIILAVLLIPGVHYALTPLNGVLFVLALVLAWFLRYIQAYVVGLLAFWISESHTIQDIFFAIFLLLGGIVAPIDLLPPWLAAIAHYLPFRYMLSLPIEILMGREPAGALVFDFALALGWAAVLFGLYLFVWRRGLRAFQAFGA
ncbi:MAG TPA: ABC-2 family transporter protein [Anaerolineae bacterium]